MAQQDPIAPKQFEYDPSSPLCVPGSTVEGSVCLTLPTDSIASKVDIFFLFDDTGSFAAYVRDVSGIAHSLVSDLQYALPSVDFGFGVGRFEDYGGPGSTFSGERTTGRPFLLNQPIVTAVDGNVTTLIDAALTREGRGFGGDGPESAIAEGLYQVAVGDGFDGNDDGSTNGMDGTQVAGALSSQIAADASGDVPAFASLNAAVPHSGTIGGAGFRKDALKLVILATDICSVAAFAGTSLPADVDGEPVKDFGCSSKPGERRFGFVSDAISSSLNTVSGAVVPKGAHTVMDAVNALKAQNIRVMGMGPDVAPKPSGSGPDNGPSTFLSAMARITGAIDAGGKELVFPIGSGVGPLRNAIVEAVGKAVVKPVDVDLVSQNCENIPADIKVKNSPKLQVKPGEKVCFDFDAVGYDANLFGQCGLAFYGSGTFLGYVPFIFNCYCNPQVSVPKVITFEYDANFQNLDHGDYVSTFGDGQGTVSVSVKPFGDGIGPRARIYDTSRGVPVSMIDPENEDPDLDCTDQGNALIIQESDAAALPDDNADGGVFTFVFSPAAAVHGMTLLDMESKAKVTTFHTNGSRVRSRTAKLGNCGVGYHHLHQTDVTKMTVKLRDSGAIADLHVCWPLGQ